MSVAFTPIYISAIFSQGNSLACQLIESMNIEGNTKKQNATCKVYFVTILNEINSFHLTNKLTYEASNFSKVWFVRNLVDIWKFFCLLF